MLRFLTTFKNRVVVIFTIILLTAFPAAVTFADSPAPCTPPPNTQNGVRWPTGSDASTFTYQCDGKYSGEWTNAYYVYDPTTNQRSPLYDLDYTYDCTTAKWYMVSMDFVPAKNAYQKDIVETTQPAGLATNCPVVPITATSSPSSLSSATNNSVISPNTKTIASSPATGSSLTTNGNNNTAITNSTGAAMNNGVLSFAGSGDASVTGNSTGGSATSGNAQVEANVINMLQSSSNILGNPNMITFTANINGDVNGDLLLDPAKLGTIQPANSSTTLNNNVTVNNSLNTSMNNNIALNANSGNADVSRNTTGGDATTGTASAVANIVNVMNSAVTAGKSFMGIININGDFNGDILLPPNFVNTLLASNVPRYNVNTSQLTNNVNVTNNSNQAINNTIGATATSGDAAVTGNTSAGSATSGSGKTNLTVFNLTGNSVVASNDIFVFVNVLGTWYGMILNAPVGSTAASLGGGVTSSTVNNNEILNNTANQTINNNVNVNAKSGNATVADNTTGGNAKSGDTNASVNLMNMINDRLSLNGWFGLLFINVFGTWNGSFGINTASGNSVVAPQASGNGASSPTFQFVPSTGSGPKTKATIFTAPSNFGGDPANNAASGNTKQEGTVLAANTVKNAASTIPGLAHDGHTNYILPLLGLGLAVIILIAGERNRFLRRS